MLLRESGRHDGVAHHYESINGEDLESASVPDADVLLAYGEAFHSGDRYALRATRDALASQLGEAALVDAAATIAIFNAVVRIADATGIELEAYKVDGAADLREQLGIDAFRAHD